MVHDNKFCTYTENRHYILSRYNKLLLCTQATVNLYRVRRWNYGAKRKKFHRVIICEKSLFRLFLADMTRYGSIHAFCFSTSLTAERKDVNSRLWEELFTDEVATPIVVLTNQADNNAMTAPINNPLAWLALRYIRTRCCSLMLWGAVKHIVQFAACDDSKVLTHGLAA